jgi:hypothetical protein
MGSRQILPTMLTTTVPAGTFECIAYRLPDFDYETYLCFAPGVGLIRVQVADSPTEDIELVSFDLVE